MECRCYERVTEKRYMPTERKEVHLLCPHFSVCPSRHFVLFTRLPAGGLPAAHWRWTIQQYGVHGVRQGDPNDSVGPHGLLERLPAAPLPAAESVGATMSTIADLIPAFLDYMANERRLARSTMKSYVGELRALHMFVNQDVTYIGADELRAYLRHLSKRKRSAATIHRKFACFRTFWKWLRLESMVSENVIERIELPRKGKYIAKWLSAEELHRFVDTPAEGRSDDEIQRNRAAWLLMAWLGVRRGELLGIRCLDVLDTQIIIHGIKTYSDRLMPLPAALRPALAKLTSGQDAMRYLLRSEFGGQWSIREFEHAFYNHLQKADLAFKGYTPHSLRHTFGTLLSGQGVDVPEVQQLMGHASIASTMMYVHVNQQRLRNAMSVHVLNEVQQ